MKENRTPIPKEVANIALFLSNRSCCVCRTPGRAIQLHHLDGNRNNHKLDNLAVLCLQCHDETLLKGGFGRKLNSGLIKLYRNELYLENKRRFELIPNLKNIFTEIEVSKKQQITKNTQSLDDYMFYITIDMCYENEYWGLLAFEYNIINQKELAKKYANKSIEKAIINEDWIEVITTKIFIFGTEDIEPDLIEKAADMYLKQENYCDLARLYQELGYSEETLIYYNKGIEKFIKEKNWFSAGFYLRESGNIDKAKIFFNKALKSYLDKVDVFWILRSYEELEMFSELKKFAEDIIENNKFNNISDEEKLKVMEIIGNEEEAKRIMKILKEKRIGIL